jgi:hypothetical protein
MEVLLKTSVKEQYLDGNKNVMGGQLVVTG